jgi:hypothetical protein
MRYTLRSSSDPRGRLRGAVAGPFGDAVAGAFGIGGVMGAPIGCVERTRAFCIFGDPEAGGVAGGRAGAAAGAVLPTAPAALAIPMNVAGDNMGRTLSHQWLTVG